MTRRRLVLYILLNALVSILVSGAVLYFYERANHKTDCATIEVIPTLPSGSVKAEITSVTGTGVIADESVVIRNNGDASLLLTSWTVKGNQGDVYTFPQLTLYPDGTVQLHTGVGNDTASDLYWQRTTPVWNSGDLVALYDTHNIARAFYRIP
jgi:hypothetical protein